MAIPAWFWPASGAARGSAAAAFNSGLLISDWSAPQVWPFSVASGAFSAPIALPSGSAGVCGLAPITSASAFALTYAGELYSVTAPSGAIKISGLPTANVYTGVAPTSGTGAYSVAANGSVYGYSGGVASGTFNSPAWFAISSGTTLCSLLPALSGVGTFSMATAVTGLIALPSGMASPSALTFSSGGVLAVAGWANAPLLSGAAAGAVYPLSATQLLAVGGGSARAWAAPSLYSDAWVQSGALSGLANLNAVAWRPDGAQALATSVVSGVVQVIGYSVGTLTLAQTLSVTGAVSVVVAGDSLHALVCQSGQSQALPLLFSTGSWATGTAVTGLPGIVAAVASGVSGACVAYASGLASVTLSGSAWVQGATVALPFTPTALAVDTFGQFYAAGSGAVALVSGNALVASGTWSGGIATAIAVNQGRIELAVPGDGLIRTFALATSAALSGMATQPISATSSGLAFAGASLFSLAASGTALFGFTGAPFALTSVQYGAAGVYSGGVWTTYAFGAGHTPSAICFDASGKLQVATVQNTWWTLTSGAAFSASGIVTQYAGQTQNVPLGTAGLLSSGGHLYAATSLPGVLVEVA